MSSRELASGFSMDSNVIVQANSAYGLPSFSQNTEQWTFDEEISPEYSSIGYGT